MNIVRIFAGLGNQLFQYAFFRALQSNFPDTKMDISEFKYRKHHNGYELERLFNIQPVYSTKEENDALADYSKDLFSEIRRKIFCMKRKCSGKLIIEGKQNYNATELLALQNAYFIGYWQSEKYFKSIEDSLRKELTFKSVLDDQNLAIAEDINTCNSVAIHVRRGDYLKSRRRDSCGTVCSLAYYNRAIEQICSQVANPRFFIFSDDKEWVKENLLIENAVYVDINSRLDSYKDMQLMSLCKHNIIANSSFSWWGAWLNNNPNKVVLAPSIWMRNMNYADVLPDSWIKIEVD